MTFEEAIAVAVKSKEKWGGGSSEAWLVNVLNALGVLKIEEPKSANEQFRSAVREIGVHLSELTIKSALEKSGLKLVPNGSPPPRRPRMTDHTPTPWHWVIHDSSMASIEGPKEEFDHVLSISPCKNCQGEDWKWGSCTVISETDANFIVKAVNSHEALVKALFDLVEAVESTIDVPSASQAFRSRVARGREVLSASVGSPS